MNLCMSVIQYRTEAFSKHFIGLKIGKCKFENVQVENGGIQVENGGILLWRSKLEN